MIRVLQESYQLDTSGARAKSWDEYKHIIFDFVITLCDNAKERCPFWPGQPIIAHWSTPDPADFVGIPEDTYRHFWQISRLIYRRLEMFCDLPFEKLDRPRLEHATKEPLANKFTGKVFAKAAALDCRQVPSEPSICIARMRAGRRE